MFREKIQERSRTSAHKGYPVPEKKMSDLDKFNYECPNQISMFDIMRESIRITKPIRLIELFAGYGSQAMALRNIGAQFEHYRVVEFDKYAIASYNAVHGTDFPTMDITKVHAKDLDICDTGKYCYLMTYSFPCTDLSLAGKQAGMKREVVQGRDCCGKLKEY